MNKTTRSAISSAQITVDITGLMELLQCGESTAKQIGEQARARIFIGRRIFYSVDMVRQYIETMAE